MVSKDIIDMVLEKEEKLWKKPVRTEDVNHTLGEHVTNWATVETCHSML
jgi:hypothetical protein